jgi:hypothetical protein
MWSCTSCGAPNEPENILCSQCGSLKVKPAPREGSPQRPDESPASRRGRFQGNVWNFCLWWMGGTVAGELLGWGTLSALQNVGVVLQGENQRASIAILLQTLLSGLATGLAQAVVLRVQVVFRSGIRWAGATAAGALVNGGVYLVTLKGFGSLRIGGVLAALLAGALGAATAGVLQSRLLLRNYGPPGWTMGWTQISVGAELLGISALSPLLYFQSLPPIPAFWNSILFYGLGLTPTAIFASGTGLALGRWLKRRSSVPPVVAA